MQRKRWIWPGVFDGGVIVDRLDVIHRITNDVLCLQGKLYVRGDSKIFRFQNPKSESLFLQRKNPRRISWTVLYRRQHRKGISEVRSEPSPPRPVPVGSLRTRS